MSSSSCAHSTIMYKILHLTCKYHETSVQQAHDIDISNARKASFRKSHVKRGMRGLEVRVSKRQQLVAFSFKADILHSNILTVEIGRNTRTLWKFSQGDFPLFLFPPWAVLSYSGAEWVPEMHWRTQWHLLLTVHSNVQMFSLTSLWPKRSHAL